MQNLFKSFLFLAIISASFAHAVEVEIYNHDENSVRLVASGEFRSHDIRTFFKARKKAEKEALKNLKAACKEKYRGKIKGDVIYHHIPVPRTIKIYIAAATGICTFR